MVPDCDSKSIHLRRLCRPCYTYAASLVFHKIVTWKELEAAGCVGMADSQIQSPKRPVRVEWFSRAAGLPPDMLARELRSRAAAYNRNKRTR